MKGSHFLRSNDNQVLLLHQDKTNNKMTMPTIQQVKQWVPLVNRPGIYCCLDNNTKILSIEELLMDTAPKENYVVIGTMFDICHANRDRDEDTVNKNGYPTSKKVKKNYNRIYEFGNTDGTTFCIICETESKGKAILANWQGICIGQNFLLFEPKQVKDQTLRKDMPVLDVSNALVPLMDKVPTLLPPIPIREPNQSGEATFFLLQKQRVMLSSCEIRGAGDIAPPSCSGYACDRKDEEKPSHACGCFRNMNIGRVSPIVLEYSADFVEKDKVISLSYLRSFRTTSLFIKNANTVGLNMKGGNRIVKLKEIRAAVATCCEHINEHGGFTIGGTVSKGMRKDLSDPSSLVLSDESTYNLCFLMPTKMELLTEEEFVTKQYHYNEEDEQAAVSNDANEDDEEPAASTNASTL